MWWIIYPTRWLLFMPACLVATTPASGKPLMWLNKGCDGFGKSCTMQLKKVSGIPMQRRARMLGAKGAFWMPPVQRPTRTANSRRVRPPALPASFQNQNAVCNASAQGLREKIEFHLEAPIVCTDTTEECVIDVTISVPQACLRVTIARYAALGLTFV